MTRTALRLRSASTNGSTSAAPGPASPTAEAAVGLAVTTTRRYCCGWPGGKKCWSAHCSA
uniref:Uncharacterized protein n=1 Tax=Arundo donax TaxID=35708 RepID=A0A0A9DSK1_ARUDO